MMMRELGKWRKTISVSLSRYMAFKADFFLMLVAPSLVFIAINYNIWRSIYESRGGGSISGFTMDQMLHYQCWSFIVALLVRSHRTWNLSEHIRLGRMTAFLLYPFDAWKFYTSEFIAFQMLQCVTAALAIGALGFFNFLPPLDLSTCLVGIGFSLLVSVLWFVIDFTFGLVAFWLEEVWIFRVIFGFFAVLFSGAFIPIELFPGALQRFLEYTPFPFITSVPVHMFLGTSHVSLLTAAVTLLGWIAILSLGAMMLWRRGLRLYNAAGI
jgi:ABC-2 type transport system permease protein